MEDKLQNLLSSCGRIDFGVINLSDEENNFYKELNNVIIALCKSLPESAQTDALLFIMKYSGLTIGRKLDFFKNYYVPSWSSIYWLARYFPGSNVFSQEDIKNAISAHSMAMFLHSLDDHINDREIPASHLTLLLRSQSWMMMISALKNLSEGCEKGVKTAENFIDKYYSGVLDSNDIATLDDYCDLFRKQMATWLIVPVLMTQKMAVDREFSDAFQSAYGSFGAAWRLLDDIRDIEIDMGKRTHSAIYVCLPENIKRRWDNRLPLSSHHRR